MANEKAMQPLGNGVDAVFQFARAKTGAILEDAALGVIAHFDEPDALSGWHDFAAPLAEPTR